MSARKYVCKLLVGFVTVLLGACQPSADTPAESTAANSAGEGLTVLWETSDGIDTPESAYFDPASGLIFVSQVAGQPDERDGNGRILQMRPDGTVLSEAWVSGLNAPKGLRSYDGVLWTADIDEIIGIDMTSAQVTTRVAVDGAQFLNDVAVGDDGTVYVSDTVASRIYALRNGTVEVFAEGDDLEWPNGLFVAGGRLVVGGWGRPEADFTTLVPGRLFSLDLETKEKTLITPEPFANIDGVESDGRDGWILTDFQAGKLMHVRADGAVSELGPLAQGTADLGFIAERDIVIVPHMNESRVVAYDLSRMLD